MTDRLDQLDYYTLLGLTDDATPDDVRQAFHEFALRYHPDRHVGTTEEKVDRATEIYRRGAEAYRVLLDPRMRAEYDVGLEAGRVRFDPEDESASSGRNPTTGSFSLAAVKARPFATKAQAAIASGDLRTARLNLQIALKHDADNTKLTALLAEVESQLSKK